MRKKGFYERGQALILIAIGITGLIGFVALAIDGGNVFMDRRNAQNAADAAAFAAAYAKIANVDATSAALNIASSNGYQNDGTRSTVTMNYPPAAGCKGVTGPYAGNNEYLQVIIHSNLEAFFAQVVGINQFHNCVEAITYVKPSYGEDIFWGNALVSLNPDGCMSFDVGGTANGKVTGGGVFVNSSSTCIQGAFRQRGKAVLSSAGVCVVGSYNYEVGKVNSPPTNLGCKQQAYPPEWLYPNPDCGTNIATNVSGNDWSPGYIQGKNIKGTMNLQKGIYCIDGDVNTNAGDVITGSGILLYVMNGKFFINGGSTIQLTAPTSGSDPSTEDYIGLLIYLPLSNSNLVEINGTSASFYSGTILAPASLIRVNGFANTNGLHSQVIGFDIELTGTGDLNIHYEDADNYDALIPPSIELVH